MCVCACVYVKKQTDIAQTHRQPGTYAYMQLCFCDETLSTKLPPPAELHQSKLTYQCIGSL